LLLVLTDVPPEIEEEFNRWYDEEHIPERLAVPGFVGATRYRAVEGSPRYLALYELSDVSVLQSEPYLRLLNSDAWTEWTTRIRPQFQNLLRNVYVRIYPPE
jgi:hypothetical protein